MCELFCFNSIKSKKLNDYLKRFYNHSDEHPHGWGFVNIKNDDYTIVKEPVKAKDSQKLKHILEKPIIGKNMFAHIRLATVGNVKPCNCHPFVKKDNNGRCWMLMHNGTIFDYPQLEKYRDFEKGDTDSERILLYILDEVNKLENQHLTLEQRFDFITDIIVDLSCGNKLNLMLFDGEITYVHSNMKDSMYYLKYDECFIFSSTPLCEKNWKAIELNKVFGLADGEILFESEKHNNEFIFTEKHEKAIEEFLKSCGGLK